MADSQAELMSELTVGRIVNRMLALFESMNAGHVESYAAMHFLMLTASEASPEIVERGTELGARVLARGEGKAPRVPKPETEQERRISGIAKQTMDFFAARGFDKLEAMAALEFARHVMAWTNPPAAKLAAEIGRGMADDFKAGNTLGNRQTS